MSPIDYLEDNVWTHPGSYAGFSPDGDYLIASQHRDSDSISRSNYTCAFKQLREAAEALPGSPEAPEEMYRDQLSPRSAGWVYDFRAGCSLVSWVEYLLVRADAPDELLQVAGEIVCSIASYPVLDDDHHSELEEGEIDDYWASLSVRDRIDAIHRSTSSVSIFSARRDERPYDDNGALQEYLRD